MTPSDRILRQYIAEALDPPRHEEVANALNKSAALRERLALLLATTIGTATRMWTLPPPGVRAPWIVEGHTARHALLDGDRDAWIELSIRVPDAHLKHVVVVLQREDHDWSVVFPTGPDEVLRAEALPTNPSGLRRIDVATAPVSRRLAVVLMPSAPAFDDPDPWLEAREAVATGRYPVATFDVPAR